MNALIWRLAAAKPESSLLKQRAGKEVEQITRVCQQYANRAALVALQQDEPVGLDALHAMATA